MSLYDWLALPFGAQWRLAVWLPLVGYGAWLLLTELCGVRCPKTRFWSLLAVVLLAPLIFVPPTLAVLPHVMGWKSSVIPPEAFAQLATVPEHAPPATGVWAVVFYWPLLFVGVAVHCALAVGLAEHLWAWGKILLLPKRREGSVRVLEVPGLKAFTFGLFIPRVYVGREVWDGPHRDAVVAHERAHARRRDPLLLFVAGGIRRSTLYLPFGGRLFDELCLEAERGCDLAGTRAAGRKRYARALVDFAESGPYSREPVAAMHFGLREHLAPKPRGRLLPVWVLAAAVCFGVQTEPAPALSLMPGGFGLPTGSLALVSALVAFTLLTQLRATSPREGRISQRVQMLLPAGGRPERLGIFWTSFAILYALILLAP